jgi:hypothetical protein
MESFNNRFQLLFCHELLHHYQHNKEPYFNLSAWYKSIIQEILCIRSICEPNIRQPIPCSIDQVVLKEPKIRISLNPRLSVHSTASLPPRMKFELHRYLAT